MHDKMECLLKNNTWNLVELPEGRQTIENKWIYKIKQNSAGSIAKYIARLVAKGYTQQEGIDYTQTFAPIAKFTTIRTILTLVAMKGYSITQLNVSIAYLNADIDANIY